MLNEVLESFSSLSVRVYVDGTLGAGGHASAMVQHHPEMQALVGIDVDPTAHTIAQQRLAALATPQLRMSFLRGNYCDMLQLLSATPNGSLVGSVDAMLLDLGVSSMQIDAPDRGFSFLHDGPIDMRMDPSSGVSARELVNTLSEAELGRLLREYGEEKMWRQVARRIVEAREAADISSTGQLVAAVGRTIRRGAGGTGGKRGRGIHPATRTFQALRIAVNDELLRLEAALPAAIRCLAPGGRLAVISFHSLEDRLVKHAFLRAAGKPTPAEEALTQGPDAAEQLSLLEARALGRSLTRKPLLPSEQEAAANPRARSAKLRVFEKAGGAGGGTTGGKAREGRRERPSAAAAGSAG